MKKLLTMIVVLACAMIGQAQNYATLHVEEIESGQFDYCMGEYDGVIVYAQAGCPAFEWNVNGEHYYNVDSLVLISSEYSYDVSYTGCGIGRVMSISFYSSEIENPFSASVVWKRQDETVTLSTGYYGYDFLWSTGSTENEIEVSTAGIYSVYISGFCVDTTFSIEVCNNVELFRATTELEHNRNQATWQTTPEQAEYVQEVNVYRNNQLVATVPYTDGVFTDNIGSADAPWQYHLVAVSNGEECPLRSYWARTISMSDLMGSQGTQTLTWTSYEQENPAKGDEVQSYGIFDVVGGNPRLIIEVGSFVNMYNYDPSNFDGYAAVAAIFSRDGKSPLDFEDCAFSNRTEAPLGLGEHEAATFSVYPNPSNGVFTVEGAGTMTVTNIVGQTIHQQEIDGVTPVSLNLRAGYYFLTVGLPDGASTTKKLIVR